MNEELEDEVEAINSIYGDNSLVYGDGDGIYVLSLPGHATTLRLQFPPDYPSVPPSVLGTQTSGDHAKKGEGARVLEQFRATLGRLFNPGEVCLFDVIEEVTSQLGASPALDVESPDEGEYKRQQHKDDPPEHVPSVSLEGIPEPPWVLSDVAIENKSVFVARCCPVTSPDEAKLFLHHLLQTDKKAAKATHNITAWRIRGEHDVAFQDCDDDGEDAAGGRLLHLMQLMDLWNVMVIVTRWYGGVKLGEYDG